MDPLKNSLKAATLVETLVALTIISLVAGFADSIFLRLSRPSNTASSLLMAQQYTAEILDTSRSLYREDFYGLQFKRSNLNYTLVTSPYGEDLRMVDIRVRDNSGFEVYQRRRLIYLGKDGN